MIKHKTKVLIDSKINALVMNLENNYKDLARQALVDLTNTVEDLKEKGELKEKDYIKVRKIVDDYTTRMEGYHH